jgi:hypothetical protein
VQVVFVSEIVVVAVVADFEGGVMDRQQLYPNLIPETDNLGQLIYPE